MPLRIASISPASPKPFSTRSAPSFASSVAMPRPMPLVDPVTMATLPFNMAIPFDVSRDETGRRSIAAMDVMGDDAELGRRRIEALRIGQRAADIVEPALPMRPHRVQAELVVLRMAFVDLGLVDQLDDVVGAVAGHVGDGANLRILPGAGRQLFEGPLQ